jgi:hypothetical protein
MESPSSDEDRHIELADHAALENRDFGDCPRRNNDRIRGWRQEGGTSFAFQRAAMSDRQILRLFYAE